MEGGRTKPITSVQLEMLVSFMEMHPSLAIGQTKSDYVSLDRRRSLWLELHQKLNSVGPRKTMDRWKKAWADQKTKTQIKAVRLIENDGKSTKLTPIEERILKVIALSSKGSTADLQRDPSEADLEVKLPLISQNGSLPLENRELADSLLSESSSLPCLETPLNNAESIVDTMPTENVPVSIPEFGMILPDTPHFTLTSLDLPILIKQEPPDEVKCVEETTSESSPPVSTSVSVPPISTSESVPPVSTTSSMNNKFASYTSKQNAEKARKRKFRFTSKYMTAEKAAESFVNIAERNCHVLERIATAMETQAEESAKQTQLMQDLIDVLRNK